MSSFAKKLGGKVAQANAEHHDAPVDTGNRQLPAGIREGVAKLSTMYTKEYDKGDLKGQTFFRASAIVISPAEFDGHKVAGGITSVMVPLCDIPAKGDRKAKTFSENFCEFQNVFKLLGVAACPETPATDPTGQRTEAYFFAAMKMLTDPTRVKTNPVYIEFSTRGWTPPATALKPKPEPMVFETWHGLAKYNGQVDPAAGVTDSAAATQPSPMSAPPSTNHQQPPQTQPQADVGDPADIVAALVETAMNDPEGATDEGMMASKQLEELAWSAGWSKEQTAGATDWAQVGDMALNAPTAPAPANTATPANVEPAVPTVGSKWMFCKRTKDGAKLKNNKNEEFPPQEVEVIGVNDTTKTCTVKTTKDGKTVVDIRSKQPVEVKFEWLERGLPY